MDLREFRDSIHFTQEQMAAELKIKEGHYAMMERGKRDVTPAVKAAFQEFRAIFPKVPMHLSASLSESADLTAVLDKVKITPDSFAIAAADCLMQIIDLQKT